MDTPFQLAADTVSVLAVAALVIAVVAIFAFIAKRIRRVPPNEALIIVGRGAGRAAAGETGQRVVVGGRVFVWPVLQQGFPISLEQRQIGITVEGVDKNRIKIAIRRPSTSRSAATRRACVVRPSGSCPSRAR